MSKGKTGGRPAVDLREVRGTPIRKPAFGRSLDKANEEMERRLDGFLRRQDEKAVHDARTAIRRLEARIDLLPGEVRRSAEVKELLKRLRKVMKKSAAVRDIDVIKSRVPRYPGDAAAGLLLRLDEDRERAAKEAKRAAKSARKLSLPKGISKGVTRGKLSRRFSKVVGRLAGDIEKALPIVASDPRKLEELHKLRIECKKLRYTLELAMGQESAPVGRLKGWQDALGSIHDWDITIAFLEKAGPAASEKLLRDAKENRGREFQGFSRSVLGTG